MIQQQKLIIFLIKKNFGQSSKIISLLSFNNIMIYIFIVLRKN